MKVRQNNSTILVLVILLAALTSTCDQPVTSFSYDDDIVSKRRSQLVIEAVDSNGNIISDFSVHIDGPNKIQQIVDGTQFTSEIGNDGTYNIHVSKTGYVGYRYPLVVNHPADVFSEIQMHVTARLVTIETPTSINNAAGMVFRGGFTQKPGLDEVPSELILQPGSLPSSVPLELSISRISVINTSGMITTFENLTVLDVFGLNQNGVSLTKNATWKIPLQVNEQIRNLRPTFWLIPADWSSETGAFTLRGSPIPAIVDNNFDYATFLISTLGSYALATDLGFRFQANESTPTQVFRSSCGIKSETIYQFDTGTASPSILYMNPFLPSQSQKISTKRSFSGVDRNRIIVEASNVVQRWQLLHPTTRSVVQQSTINSGPVRFYVSQQRCLDSGGS
jgi:hypothetical protein